MFAGMGWNWHVPSSDHQRHERTKTLHKNTSVSKAFRDETELKFRNRFKSKETPKEEKKSRSGKFSTERECRRKIYIRQGNKPIRRSDKWWHLSHLHVRSSSTVKRALAVGQNPAGETVSDIGGVAVGAAAVLEVTAGADGAAVVVPGSQIESAGPGDLVRVGGLCIMR